MNTTDTADEYLRRCGVHPDLYDFGRCKDAFLSDMTAGLLGEPSSMKMIPAYLSTGGRLPAAGSAIALDIGGTNLRIALVSCRGGALRIERLEEFPVPGLTGPITKTEFFGELAGRLKPYVQTSGAVGICFSHAAEILPNLDGKLISFSKEITVTGSEGMLIAEELAGALNDCVAGETIKKYVLVNDTAAVLLGGAAAADSGFDGLIGFVLGTGMNLCYEEKTQDIKKLKGAYNRGTMLVNTESGYFMGVPAGIPDLELDSQTAAPGTGRLEKMIGGGYLGRLILLTLRRMASEGLLSPKACDAVLSVQTLELAEVSAFLSGTGAAGRLYDACRSDRDREIVAVAADRLIERAAKLAAVQIAAVLEKTGAGKRRDRPVGVVAEGSTFYKLHSFSGKFESYLRNMRIQNERRFCRVVSVDNATVLGAAFAALTH